MFEVPIYICAGFLDSGKTCFVKETLMEQDFIEAGTTLLLQCEEGETEYEEAFLDKHDIKLLEVEKPEQLNLNFFKNCDKIYEPSQVVIEYNGTWEIGKILNAEFPETWKIDGIFATVDATTLTSYLNNMRKMFMEPLLQAELIVVNRCTDQTDRASFRRTVKASNPQVQLIFEHVNGDLLDQGDDALPYDLSADFLDLHELDYGIWFMDSMENPQRYDGKTIRFLAQLYTGARLGKNEFIPGRFVMNCCEADARFFGHLCKFSQPIQVKKGSWYYVTVKLRYEYAKAYHQKGAVLYLQDIQPAKKPTVDPVPL
ncbi:MAG TPA: hypothetical protein IAB26_10715 [Candidatus Limivivens merdigallinarum]|uniref:CobW/HypB/UreG nucleotide-binding domain-containing protein n=1 Tax=Candidatus Limivivens merdigallinarum TaxID=2840859 RepID=A0A9D0ZWV4_9FIRM|nr:hypothetical protein [Candidatus Limivivens merdigallinarum]